MRETTPDPIAWRKSSYSADDIGQCVEVAATWGGGVQHGRRVEADRSGYMTLLRDSRNPTGPVLTVAPGAWRALLNDIKSI